MIFRGQVKLVSLATGNLVELVNGVHAWEWIGWDVSDDGDDHGHDRDNEDDDESDGDAVTDSDEINFHHDSTDKGLWLNHSYRYTRDAYVGSFFFGQSRMKSIIIIINLAFLPLQSPVMIIIIKMHYNAYDRWYYIIIWSYCNDNTALPLTDKNKIRK